jgi:lipid-A-disaccharide synthase
VKYYLIAGEASGDLHASHAMKEILKMDAQAQFRYWGGDLMQAQGGTLVKHYKEMAFMGFWEVVKNLKTLLGFIKECKRDIATYQPDAIILVDYAGFNLKIAAFTKSLGIPTHFYIAPKVWAWNEKRVEKLRKYVDELYVIFPFEKDFFEQKHKLPVHYVGNPLMDTILDYKPIDEKVFRITHNLDERPIIALLPGSRSQEIKHMLPLMSQMSNEFPDYQFVIAGAPNREQSFYKPYISGKVSLVSNQTYELLSIAHSALVTSGTATLETALFKVPQVVCYHSSEVSYRIAKFLVKDLKFISLVNLVVDEPVVTELIQHDFEKKRLKTELEKVLNPIFRKTIFENYLKVEEVLGEKGCAYRVALHIVNALKE